VRTEEFDREVDSHKLLDVKKGRQKLEALHNKVGGCKQF
jgi:hypothetical protein